MNQVRKSLDGFDVPRLVCDWIRSSKVPESSEHFPIGFEYFLYADVCVPRVNRWVVRLGCGARALVAWLNGTCRQCILRSLA
jgi:hypothetical protein